MSKERRTRAHESRGDKNVRRSTMPKNTTCSKKISTIAIDEQVGIKTWQLLPVNVLHCTIKIRSLKLGTLRITNVCNQRI